MIQQIAAQIAQRTLQNPVITEETGLRAAEKMEPLATVVTSKEAGLVEKEEKKQPTDKPNQKVESIHNDSSDRYLSFLSFVFSFHIS